ncbi:MAG: hypothetical protein QXF05_04495, partial [Thermofilaceae archaeon]
ISNSLTSLLIRLNIRFSLLNISSIAQHDWATLLGAQPLGGSIQLACTALEAGGKQPKGSDESAVEGWSRSVA